jgi:5-formyltetrahydrofolate cyclo-ligase
MIQSRENGKPGSLFSQKSHLRQAIRERLRTLDSEDRKRRSLKICRELGQLLAGKKKIALFAPRRTEPDLDLLWELDLPRGRVIAYPRCDGSELRFFAVSTLQELHPGKFGIREPQPKQLVEDPDAIVVPALAFTKTGSRLGQGAGFYDRFLERSPGGTIKIGACFDFQIMETLPHEEHDIHVDLLVYG